MRFAFVDAERAVYPVSVLCRVLRVSRPGYYAWQHRRESKWSRTDRRLSVLVREAHEGLWTLPGGWADVNDSPSGAVRREIEQEAGLRTRVRKLAALYDRNAHGHTPSIFHSWKAFFLCEVEGGEIRGSYETDAVGFFDPHALPPMSLERCTPGQVLRMRQHWLEPDIPTDFD